MPGQSMNLPDTLAPLADEIGRLMQEDHAKVRNDRSWADSRARCGFLSGIERLREEAREAFAAARGWRRRSQGDAR